MIVLQLPELKVKSLIILMTDDKWAIDFTNNWSISGHTRHKNVKQYFPCELKEEGFLIVQQILGEENDANLFKKILIFEKCTS